MEERRIENIKYYNIGAIFTLIALVLKVLPEEYERVLLEFGVSWGGWWFSLVDSAYLIFLALGIAAMAKAYNYNHKLWPSSKNED
ncbi:MAG: hypothetical protein GY784_11160 [Gammaproteobacteria bacterium]|nr:hypothetical protein [Gammaproteobacteria bacterium]